MCVNTGMKDKSFGYNLAEVPSRVDKLQVALFLHPKLSTGLLGVCLALLFLRNRVTELGR